MGERTRMGRGRKTDGSGVMYHVRGVGMGGWLSGLGLQVLGERCFYLLLASCLSVFLQAGGYWDTMRYLVAMFTLILGCMMAIFFTRHGWDTSLKFTSRTKSGVLELEEFCGGIYSEEKGGNVNAVVCTFFFCLFWGFVKHCGGELVG